MESKNETMAYNNNNESTAATMGNCSQANTEYTDYEMFVYHSISWWLEYVGIMSIGITGFLGNTLTIPLSVSYTHLTLPTTPYV